MKFDLKTTSKHGVLFYMIQDDGHDFLALDMVDGHPRYHIRCKQMFAKLTIRQIKVNDNQWHKVC